MSEPTLLQRRHQVMGDASPLFYDEPLELVKGEGVWLIDANGKRYLDCYNNVPCVGHCHPKVVAAMAEQAATLNIHTRYLNERVVRYAENLTATFAEPLDSLMFTCTGSEANELALRMARFVTGNKGVIVSDYNYHGNTTSLAAVTTALPSSEPFSAHARAVPIPCLYQADGTPEQVADRYVAKVAEAIAELQAAGVGLAAMLIDTLFANEGIPRLPAGYLERVAKLVRDAGGLLIADEVQSGFARTGEHLWGHQAHPFVPDIVTLGKPMGNGFPLAGLVTSRERVETFGHANLYFNTFGGSPVAAAVGQAVLDVIAEEDLQGNALRQSAKLSAELHRLAERHSIIGDVRGKGLFFAVELVRDRTSREPAGLEARRIVNAMRQRGVLISKIGGADNILKIRPPLPFQAEHGELFIDTLDQVLGEL
ncbi:aspartate aminotransferase family protein [Pseudomonas nitroreducens]|uniref:aspartate aminotransferase family protein n=1 Tax=Pseudomonas nitroreducens TaxID=46680 RepID=UPI001FB6529F|nr:aminotransferase class III-fold pyridoxal phosphate-dependent enzyme [Pseudomonas nitroreducens]MCJ1878271.1 aminotransferase class III-fold pyridoxal phosphate-dependent enzyme [Pseudomonas nitroreducens]MCJ1898057.1 aminotransferase class III-fold pyridoxal phosphate-dependent enzyme [Pseudomonas nitroreducens]